MKKMHKNLFLAAVCSSAMLMACSEDSDSVTNSSVDGSDMIAEEDSVFDDSAEVKEKDKDTVVVNDTLVLRDTVNMQDTVFVKDSADAVKADFVFDKGSISGVSQKGPFAKGSSVTAYELDGTNSLNQTGRSFNGTISSDDGSFKIKNVSLVSSYVHLTATGMFRDEMTGKKSASPITLRALSDLEGGRTSVNVNLVTHLEYDRVANLLDANPAMTLAEAKEQAEKEIFAMFYIDAKKFGYSEDLDIFGKDDANAALLAVSTILPTGNSASEIMERLTTLSLDMAEDGTWDAKETLDSLAFWAQEIDLNGKLPTIRNNVLSWKISEDVPNFEKYVRLYWNKYFDFGECGKDAPVGTVKSMPKGVSVKDENVRYTCVDSSAVGKVWRVADDIEKDTMGLGRKFEEAEMHKGVVNEENMYVFENGAFRKAKEQELELKKGCTAGTKDAKTKHDGIDYVCKNGAWEYDLSVFAEGEMREGFTDKENMYVFENGAFRMADKRELYLNKTCTKAFEGTTLKKEYSAYVCTNGAWEFDLENSDKGTVNDGFDDHVYKTVGIGGQLWMAENVKYYLNNSFFCFQHDAENCETYGATFDVYAFHDGIEFDPTSSEYMNPSEDNINYCGVSKGKCIIQEEHQGVCPVGFHIPSEAEFKELVAYVDLFNGDEEVATSLKSKNGWTDANAAGTDRFGFNAFPGGHEIGSMDRNTLADIGIESTFLIKKNEDEKIYSNVRYFSLDANSASIKRDFIGDGLYYARCLKNKNGI